MMMMSTIQSEPLAGVAHLKLELHHTRPMVVLVTNALSAFETFEQDLHEHIHLENNILFPRAIEWRNHLCLLRLAKGWKVTLVSVGFAQATVIVGSNASWMRCSPSQKKRGEGNSAMCKARISRSLWRYFREAAPKHTLDEEQRFSSASGCTRMVRADCLRSTRVLHADHTEAEIKHQRVDGLGRAWIGDERSRPRMPAFSSAYLKSCEQPTKSTSQLKKRAVSARGENSGSGGLEAISQGVGPGAASWLVKAFRSDESLSDYSCCTARLDNWGEELSKQMLHSAEIFPSTT